MPCKDKDSGKPAYKSPPSKLAAFFEKSRNKWKEKYRNAKKRIKQLTEQVRYWKKKNAELKKRVRELEEELAESSKKKR